MHPDVSPFRFRILVLASLLATLGLLTIPQRAAAAAAPKAVAKCQAALAKGGAKFVLKKLGTLAKCTDGIFKCIQTVDETADAGAKRTACIGKSRGKCLTALAAVTTARQAFVAATGKACAGLDPAQITGGDGLGFGTADCAEFGSAAVADLATLTTCVAKQHDCLAGRMFQLQVPRALELLQFTPPDAVAVSPANGDALVCLDDLGGSGADVGDVGLGKSVAKCQQSIAKIGAKLASARLKTVEKCVDALFACAATKTDAALTTCNAKAAAGCGKAFLKNDTQTDAVANGAAKACGDAAVFAAVLTPEGANLHALRPSAITVGPRAAQAATLTCSPLATVADYQACLVTRVRGLADDLTRFEAPRADALLDAVGCTIGECTGAPPPPETPGIKQIIANTGDGTHPLGNIFGIAADPDGTTYVVGHATENVFKIAIDGTVTQILDDTGDGQGHRCDLPAAVAAGPNHTVYVACSAYVLKIAAGGAVTPVLGPTGDGTPGGEYGDGGGIAVTSDETVYVTGVFKDNAFKITKAGGATRILSETGDGNGHHVEVPSGIGVDSQGNVFVASQNNGTLFKITAGGTVSADKTGLDFPFGIAVSGDTVYISEENRVTKRAPAGTFSQAIGSSGDGQGHPLQTALGVTVDSVGNLYVVGFTSDNAFKVTPQGGITQVIAASGDGAGHALNGPQAVAVDAQGHIYVAGTNNAFRIILP